MKNSLSVHSCGTPADGNSHVIVIPELDSAPIVEAIRATELEAFCGIHTIGAVKPEGKDVYRFAEELERAVVEKSIRRATIVGVSAGASITQALAIADSKLLRRVVLIDPEPRMTPTLGMRMVDWIEGFLPLGLPLRKRTQEFDSRPALHRVGCPTLVLTSNHAGMMVNHQAREIARRIPNAWMDHLSTHWKTPNGELSREIQQKLLTFLAIPAKRPQKNVTPTPTRRSATQDVV